MASSLPPVKNAAFTFHMALVSTADTDIFKTTPTLAAGDITVSIDGGNFANIGTLPTQIQSTGVLQVALTQAEMNGDIITVLFHDVAGAEWQDQIVTIYTAAQTFDTIEGLVDDIGAAGAGLTAVPWNAAWDAEVQSEVADALEAEIADSIPADGSIPSVKQALYMIVQRLTEVGIAATTLTVYKADGTTPLYTLTLGDATNPVTMTRAS